jgi:anti-sigma factor RsiW
MSSVNPNDLLSAYFDREGTPSEETVAKSVVEGSPEAAREIREYGRLSRLLQGLPRAAAPPEFAAAVMQRAERESLIPLDSVASRPVARPVGVGGFLRRQWMAVVASSISLVAGLLIAVMIWPRGFDAPRSRPISTDFAAVPRDELRRESPA